MDEFNAVPAALRAPLHGHTVEKALGVRDRYGANYLATETTSGRRVVLHEFLPAEVAEWRDGTVVARSAGTESVWRWALRSFLSDAAILVRLRHPNLVDLQTVFEAHGTAFVAIEYFAGESLEARLARERRLSADALRQLINPLLDGLAAAHAEGLIHHEIQPSAIRLRENGQPVLMVFSGSRAVVRLRGGHNGDDQHSVFAAPEEISASGQRGPWTDLYSLAAVAWHSLGGELPPSAMARRAGAALVPARTWVPARCPQAFADTIDWALSMPPAQRPQDVAQWREVWSGRRAYAGVLPKHDPIETPPPKIPAAVDVPVAAPAPMQAPEAAPTAAQPQRRGALTIVALAGLLIAGLAGYVLSRPAAVEPALTVANAPLPAPATVAAPATAPVPANPATRPPTQTISGSALDRIAREVLAEEKLRESAAAEAEAQAQAQAQAQAEAERVAAEREAALQREAAARRAAALAVPAAADTAAAAAAEDDAAAEAERQRMAETEARLAAEREAAAEAERQRAAAAQARVVALQQEKAACSSLHVSDIFTNPPLRYADIKPLDGVRVISNGDLLLPPMATDDGRQVEFRVTPGNCVRLIRQR